MPGRAAALSLLTTERFDVVVCDIRMPFLDGLGLLEELRLRNIAAAVVVLTACDDVPVPCQP